jgi:hypothetical protein
MIEWYFYRPGQGEFSSCKRGVVWPIERRDLPETVRRSLEEVLARKER